MFDETKNSMDVTYLLYREKQDPKSQSVRVDSPMLVNVGAQIELAGVRYLVSSMFTDRRQVPRIVVVCKEMPGECYVTDFMIKNPGRMLTKSEPAG